MAQIVTLVFDIGKTNKKLFLFDQNLNEIYNEYIRFDEISDDDGFPCENLGALTQWIKNSTQSILNNNKYEVKGINFSTYGASLVHLDQQGNVISPFYNYLKPFPEDLKTQFFEQHHGEANFSLITASPSMGFLNSGLQLYYLKYKKPDIFKKLYKSLHFPQYMCSLLTGKYASDYTSLGCHTGLWDHRNNKYAHWVSDEGFEQFLAPVHQTSKVFQTIIEGCLVNVGIGVHDSSAALVPYIQNTKEPFTLISTGTWSICMNFFNDRELTKSELENDCLNFLGIKGHSVKASRLFLGKEIREQVIKIGAHFGCEYHRYKEIPYSKRFKAIHVDKKLTFKYNHLKVSRFGYTEPETTQFKQFESFEQAYHQLIDELTDIQIDSLKLAIGHTMIKEIYIDGGFANNEVFTQMMANKLPEYQIFSTGFAMGSALGAALLVNLRTLPKNFLQNNYNLKVHNGVV